MTSAQSLAPPPTPKPPSPCDPIPDAPAAPSTAPEADAATCAYPAALLREVETRLTASYDLASPQHHLETQFGCHALDEVKTIQFAEGAGHGFNLRLYTLVREADGFVVLGQRYRGGLGPLRIEAARGHASTADVEAALTTVRAALEAQLEEKAPPSKGLGLRGRGSSHDFHLSITLADATHQWGRRFTGYEGSSNQDTYVPLRVGAAPLRALVKDLPWTEEITAEARAAFASNFLREAPFFDDEFNWWVKERYVAMARVLGTRQLIPSLVERLREGDDRSTKDTTDDAMAALAAITGWNGSRRPDREPERRERIERYRASCRPDG